MKKSTFLISCAGCLCAIALSAQPTLTATGIEPAMSDNLTINNSNYASPGSAGASQTWNLSSLSSTSTATYTGVTPASTPHAASFPSANYAASSSGAYIYYNNTATAWQYYGADNGSIVMPYSNPEDQLHFPFNFNDNYTDNWAATFTNTYTFYRTGSTVVTADGYGTLTTPDGTFGNVMRVHFVQTYQDSTNIASSPYVIYYQNDEYMWYLNGNHYPIAAVYTLTSSAGSPITGGLYLSNVVSGVNETNVLLSSSLAPNPAADHFDLALNLDKSQQVKVQIFDATGHLVATPVDDAEGIAGENRFGIDVSGLAQGMYFTRVSLNGVPSGTDQLVITR
ncbi:MAG TPA: T9SS type A sorting domain-containing protein [Bacteroidia bacterium]|nr:T9SS type A sorting domain-containing protein [Bacteroidia bacterium]